MLKKIITVGLVALLGVTFAGCNKTSNPDAGNKEKQQEQQEEAKAEEMKVTIFDVGDDNAAFIQVNGKSILIGSGSKESCGKVVKYIKNQGVDEIDHAILQEYNSAADGFVEVFENFSVKEVDTPQWHDSLIIEKSYREEIINNIDNSTELVELKNGDELSVGDAKLKVVLDKDSETDEYDKALVLRLVYGDTSILFGGESTRSKDLTKLDDIKSNVFIIPNASMVKSLSTDLVKNVDPEIGIISVTAERKGRSDMENVLKGRGAEAIYTCDGDITLISDGKTIKQK